ncbi:MAG: 50S ribosomal protein L11 methyltransferase [Thermoleophilia bacterium]|nr:50S ribosomal protein L11 methyltransferase [Thermoleophilia bacterium]
MRATTGQVSEAGVLPAGVLVCGGPEVITRHFALLCALQPVRVEADGMVCAPRSAPEAAGPALAACPLPWRALSEVPAWPDPPAAMVAGWYRRSPAHAAAPEGVRELIQTPGEGFGPADHATTAMCLEQLEHLPAADAVDVGCGSGLLCQAWVALGRGRVLACDLDGRAVDQTARSLAAAGREDRVTMRRGPVAALRAEELGGRVLLANVPLPAHESLLSRIGRPPRAVVLSGLRPGQAAAVVVAYRALGLEIVAEDERGGFRAVSMVAA